MLNNMISPERIVILTQDSILPYPSFPCQSHFKEPNNDGCRGLTALRIIIYFWLPLPFYLLTILRHVDLILINKKYRLGSSTQ
jgi:hypothetical protein